MAITLSPLSDRRTYIQAAPKRLRAVELLRRKPVWIAPILIGVVLIGLMTTLYLGSAVDPIDHMHGLPVSLVQMDGGTVGPELEKALLDSPEVSEKLAIHVESMGEAEERMDRGASYATLVVLDGFTRAAHSPGGNIATVDLLSNQRAGTTGASLASGVLTPAVKAFSEAIDRPVIVEAEQYHPLPAKAALGLSAFYASLLILMSGFIGATIINSFLDGALGFAPTEIGSKWAMSRPTLITRWQTLLAKWGMAVVLSGLFVAVFLLVAVGILGMDAPSPLLLWLYGWFGAATVAIGTLALFAVLGTPGQLVGLLLFVYLGLASAGGTVAGLLRRDQPRRPAAPDPRRRALDPLPRSARRRGPRRGRDRHRHRPPLLARLRRLLYLPLRQGRPRPPRPRRPHLRPRIRRRLPRFPRRHGPAVDLTGAARARST
jgi:hypothetical protein